MMKNEIRNVFREERAPLSITVLVLANASIMCVASTIDPLRAANRIAGERLFDWRIFSVDGEAPRTTSGLPVMVDGAFRAEASDMLIVIGGFGTRETVSRPLLSALRKGARMARSFGGVEAGSWLLARAGLLDGRQATTHWEDLEDFAQAFPAINVRPDRYVIDGPAFTAGGASPIFDLMLHLIRSRLGMAVALDVASVFIYDQAHNAADTQPLVSLGRLDGFDRRVAQAIGLMESHLDEPLSTTVLAARTGVTTRTLETIFRKAIGETPGAYYQRLRLSAARRLVIDTRLPMADVAARTGFGSTASFSRAFSAAFGKPPGRLRRA
ncbi:MAG: GlxA family transcriptional regulator [Rhizobiaceae bacterium]|nr:GlxA family transcriptional regulator [Rhizobiaceae bacterium]